MPPVIFSQLYVQAAIRIIAGAPARKRVTIIAFADFLSL